MTIDRKHGVQDRPGRMMGMFAAALLLCAGRQALADIQCQPRGRLATAHAYRHFGLATGPAGSDLFGAGP